jgi:phage terminase large subunit-like protein
MSAGAGAGAVRELSAAARIALLEPGEREELLEGLDQRALLTDPYFWLRPSQLVPLNAGGDFDLCIALAGRGWGKSRVLSEWVRHKVRTLPAGARGALVARTAADVRDVLIHGVSGILACCSEDEKPLWEPSKRLLTFPNGTSMLAFSSEAPDQLRGPQFDFAIADEIASWYYLPDESGLTAWDNLRLATRLGDVPQIVAATTPRRTPFMRALMKLVSDARTLLIRGRTADNEANLARAYLDVVYGLYSGTRLAQQELEGELLEDAENALWSEDLIESNRILDIPVHDLRVVAVDPSVAERPRDECGIVCLAGTSERELHERRVYVLEDATVHGSPAKWAQAVVDCCHRWSVRVVVAEGNQGGELVAGAIRGIDPELRVVVVHARVNKKTRAEPVAVMYESGQGRVKHVGVFPELESQMTSWEPSDSKASSPDRLDALVWGVTALAIKPVAGLVGGSLRSRGRASRARLPEGRLITPGLTVPGAELVGSAAGGVGGASGGYAARVLSDMRLGARRAGGRRLSSVRLPR